MLPLQVWVDLGVIAMKNFVTTHVETVSESIPNKSKAKCWVLWELQAAMEKCNNTKKKKSSLNKSILTNANALKLKAQKESKHTKKKPNQKQLEYIQGQINKIRRQSQLAWQALMKWVERKALSCQARRKYSEVERTFQELSWKPSWNH